MTQHQTCANFFPIFCPKFVAEQKRSSLKFGLIFCPRLGAGLNTPLGAIGYQNLTRKPELLRAPLGLGTM